MMQCKFCNGDFPKLAKSHIIPRAFYGPLFDSQENEDVPRLISYDASEYPRRSRVGAYDTEILCLDCENDLFSPLDDFAFKVLFETDAELTRFPDSDMSFWSYGEVDSDRLRLFFVSLLWRMHWSRLPMFNCVVLGKYVEHAAQALQASEIRFFPQIDIVITKFDDPLSEIIMGPTKLKIDSSTGRLNGYRVNFSKMACWVKVDKRKFGSPHNSTSVGETDILRIIKRSFLGSPEFKAAGEAARANSRYRW